MNYSRDHLFVLGPLALALLAGCDAGESLNPVPTIPAPQAPIDFIVDDLGITHVYAQNDADAFFGAGYAMAKDRLLQMELNRRQALGRSAELLGDRQRKSDIASRAMNFAKLGADDLARLRAERPEEAALIDAWTNGVNRRIAEVANGEAPRPYGLGARELDVVPAPWTAADAVSVGKLLSFGLSSTLDYEILASAIMRVAPGAAAKLPLLLPAYDTYITTTTPPPGKPGKPKPPPFHAAPLPPGAPPFPARYASVFSTFESNNWAVDGAHSTNGKPLLAGDPHQPLSSPTRLWPVHISSVEGGGSFDVIGFSFVGTPMVELGHNAHVGWTATTNFADVMDLWDTSAGKEAVSVGGQSYAVKIRTETIRVRAEDGSMTETQIDLRDVPDFGGILLPDEILPVPRILLADGSILFKWTGFAPTLEASAYLGLDRAVDLDALEAAGDRIEVGAINMVGADEHGITYHPHARIPDRGDPSSHPMPWHMLDGGDHDSLWTRGELPPDKIPHLRNPDRGFISSANNDPFGFVADGDVEDDPFYYGAFYANGFRAHRIDEQLSQLLAQRKVDRSDMEALQRDIHSSMADTVMPHLADAVMALASDPDLATYAGRSDLKSLASRLLAWDRRFDHSASEPVIFFALEWFAARRAFQAQLTMPIFETVGEKSPPFLLGMLRNALEDRFADAASFVPGGKRVLLMAALDDTASWLTQRFGSLDAPFAMKDVHAAAFPSVYGGQLAVPTVTVDGSVDTINVSPAPFFADGKVVDPFLCTEQSLYRMAMGFGTDGVPEATIDFAMGTSAEPNSAHFLDQQARWAAAQHAPLPFRKTDVEAHATERRTMPSR